MKTIIKTLTRIRDHIRNVLLPTAQGKTEGKWYQECDEPANIRTHPNGGDLIAEGWDTLHDNCQFIAMTSDTAEPAWLCVAEEIDELLPMLSRKDLPWSVARYMKRRAASIIKNWKHTIK